jgi:hypothetical protein
VAPDPDDDPGLERQRAGIEAAFREGWRPVDAGGPRVLTGQAHAEARRILSQGGWTGLDREIIQAVRGGARPGDPLPPPRPSPFIDRVSDAEVIITGCGPDRRVAVVFSHEHYPGVRFGHRFPLERDADGHGPIWLKEEIETGALHRMMQDQPDAGAAGVIWTTWGSPGPA